MIHLSPPGRHRATQPERRSRQPQLRYLAAVGLASLLVLAVASPANAKPVQPRAGEGFIAMTQRTCGSSAGWQQNQARAGTAWAYLGRTYDIQCGTRTSSTASRSTSVRSSGWVHPLASGVLAKSRGACPGAARSGHIHRGIDLSAPSGTPIRSVAAGTVTVSRFSGSAGYYVVVNHGSSTSTYMHLRQRGLGVGARVNAGQTIGLVGSTGNSTGPHLHFEATGSGNTAQTARAHGLALGC